MRRGRRILARLPKCLAESRGQDHIPATNLQIGTLPDGGPSAEAGAPLLEAEEIRFYIRCYTGADVMPDDVRAVPLSAEDFSGLPPAAILAAEADPCLADAERYAQVLAAAGVPTDLEVAKGVVHGFLRARRMSSESARAFAWLCDAARRWLAA